MLEGYLWWRGTCVVSWDPLAQIGGKDSVTIFSSARGTVTISNNLFLSPRCWGRAPGAVALQVFKFSVQTELEWQIILKSYWERKTPVLSALAFPLCGHQQRAMECHHGSAGEAQSDSCLLVHFSFFVMVLSTHPETDLHLRQLLRSHLSWFQRRQS